MTVIVDAASGMSAPNPSGKGQRRYPSDEAILIEKQALQNKFAASTGSP